MKEQKMLELRKETFLTDHQQLKEEEDSLSNNSQYEPTANNLKEKSVSNFINPLDTINGNVARILEKMMNKNDKFEDEESYSKTDEDDQKGIIVLYNHKSFPFNFLYKLLLNY